jgi:hypothetical protein
MRTNPNKSMKLLSAIVTAILLSVSLSATSQVSVNINMGSAPSWGPAGYEEAAYYYLPDVEAYYDVRASMFIYYSGGVWVHRGRLPAQYSYYDLYHGYKVVLTDYHGNTPYYYFKAHRIKYAKGYRGAPQRNLSERFENEGGHGNGKHRGGQSHGNKHGHH